MRTGSLSRSLSADSDEGSPLLGVMGNKSDNKVGCTAAKSMSVFAEIMTIFKAFPDGVAKVYSTFGPIAIYTIPGLWLLAPVLAGGMVSVTAEAFKIAKKHFPGSTIINRGERIAKPLNLIGVGYWEDLGFTWSILTTLAVKIGADIHHHPHHVLNSTNMTAARHILAPIYYSNMTASTNSTIHNPFKTDFNLIIAPLISIPMAGLITFTRYTHDKHQNQRWIIEVITNAIHAAGSSTFTTGQLQIQSILSLNSFIPLGLMIGLGILGGAAGWLKTSHPLISLAINLGITVFVENLSLALAAFAFPNDIYASLNKHDIPDPFFFSNFGLSCVYFIMLGIAASHFAWKEKTLAEVDILHSDEEESSDNTDESPREAEDGRVTESADNGDSAAIRHMQRLDEGGSRSPSPPPLPFPVSSTVAKSSINSV